MKLVAQSAVKRNADELRVLLAERDSCIRVIRRLLGGRRVPEGLLAMMRAGEFSVPKAELARIFRISRSSLYYRPSRPGSDAKLLSQIDRVHREHPDFGCRRLAKALKANHKRVARVLKEHRPRH